MRQLTMKQKNVSNFGHTAEKSPDMFAQFDVRLQIAKNNTCPLEGHRKATS